MEKYPFKKRWKRLLIGTIDCLGSVLFFPWRLMRKPLDFASVQRILVVRMDHIGDGVMARPAFHSLHKKFPHAKIDFLTSEEMAPLFANLKGLSSVLSVKHGWFSRSSFFGQQFVEFWRLVFLLRKNKYDIGIDFRGDFRNILLMFLGAVRYRISYGITGGGFLLNECARYDAGLHQVRLNLLLLKSFHVAQDNKLFPFEYMPEAIQNLWNKIGPLPPATLLPRVIIHTGSGYPSKRWPIENFKTLIQKIDQKGIAQIILIGTDGEKSDLSDGAAPSKGFIDLRGKTDLKDLPVLFDVCDIFIGGDSGPAHIAAAQGLEIILIASGTNDIHCWHPWTEHLNLLHHEVPCAPCEQKVCSVEGHPCVRNITVEQTFDALCSVLAHLQKTS